jgi:hypothetical protein
MLVVVDRHQPEVGGQSEKQHDWQQYERKCGESGAQKRSLRHQGKRDHVGGQHREEHLGSGERFAPGL